MKRFFFLLAMAASVFVAGAQTEIMQDMKKTVVISGISLNGSSIPTGDKVNGTMYYNKFGQNGNTFVLELVATDEQVTEFRKEQTTFSVSGSNVRLVEASYNGEFYYMVQKGQGGNFPIIVGKKDGKWIAILKSGIDSGMYIGMPRLKVESDIVAPLPNGTLKLTGHQSELNEYTLYSIGTREHLFTDVVTMHDKEAYITMYFDKNDKLVKWIRHQP